MSGTSLDGIDIAQLWFTVSTKGNWSYKIGPAETVPYNEAMRLELQQAITWNRESIDGLNERYTKQLAQTISAFIKKYEIHTLDAVCSHGHTILHQPEKGLTLQIGNLSTISEILKQTVVCDFRVQDVLLGGQGAPLVPIGDQLLFSDYDYCLNLGGFANLSTNNNDTRIAYDICPVNVVLNQLCESLGLPYDDEGKIARKGNVDPLVLEKLNELPFYHTVPPKSLGLEWVKENILPVLQHSGLSAEDAIATFTAHAAWQIASQCKEHKSVLVTGGGAYNTYLLERIANHKNLTLVLPAAKLLEYKEALIFGLLGVLKLRDEINCLSSVTGARHDHSSGKIYKFINT
jgi:anhydro-N-acetylmuramic acid kinase